ncbi:MAG: VCBS repeat-containing protein [Saprospiraceae bacterium]|uniref:VCBS repeat-containing protein n=1 Tax=Candidatus Defluviibacterium haderslevense TaxID=2981993 RepID=A0A9D7XIC9_9BACT|nr:VCBS repeat-containing protein [Candidatus Defluviibacterium haderslevense]
MRSSITLNSIKLDFLFIGVIIFYLSLISCNTKKSDSFTGKLFTLQDSTVTGIHFDNSIRETTEENLFTFNYIYNGAGVGIIDVNNDELQDIYFTGNQVPDKLYLNKGNFKFEDISSSAGIDQFGGWHNSVSTVDINNDGYMDLYICRGGFKNVNGSNRNLLFINNKNNTFTEQAVSYGIADEGYSIASSFFDYDNDNDLDLIVTNRPDHWSVDADEIIRVKKRDSIDLATTTRLYRNNGNNSFSDVSKETGIFPNYSYGLSATAGDINNDGMCDIYISNDFVENDYFYINSGPGTFQEMIKNVTNHVPYYAMGTDFGDIDNDGNEEIYSVEMRPDDYKRSKTTMPLMQPAYFRSLKSDGFHDQYMHNVLQYNQGNGFFSDIAQMAGVDKTDWSWAPLISDFDNDGWKDIYVTNGYLRDVYDRDQNIQIDKFLKSRNNILDSVQQALGKLPSVKLVNYIFQNNKDLSFRKMMKNWGIEEPSFSNGAAVADLDNDGDLDLVINNINDPAFIYKNNLDQQSNYLRLKLNGPLGNTQGIGAKVTLYSGDQKQYVELRTSRGYLSSSEPIVHFGLGTNTKIDSVVILWNTLKETKIINPKANQLLTVDFSKSTDRKVQEKKLIPYFVEYSAPHIHPPFYHIENEFDDYKNQQLLPQKMSALGPFLAVADVNKDGLEDFYVGGAHQQAGALYMQNDSGTFHLKTNPIFIKDNLYEDMGSVFFDADGDGDQDLYVVSGGTEIVETNPIYQDRLYVNDGLGNFSKDLSNLPVIRSSGSCVIAADIDGDGDIDLFRGGRTIPDKYPFPPKSYLLENDGHGKFIDITNDKAKELRNIGMVTSAVWVDLDADKVLELVLVGEWMPITVFKNSAGIWTKESLEKYGLTNTEGWWNKVIAEDLDNDGDMDLVCGNLGENYKFHASPDKPFQVYCDDYDGNGTFDIVLAKYNGGDLVPVRGRQCSSEQMPFLAKKFPTYKDFANAKLEDILGSGLDSGAHYQAKEFRSIILNNNKGKFSILPLPKHAQFSPIQGIIIKDLNNDGHKDIIIAGNLYDAEIETTRGDASVGLLMLGKGNMEFKPLSVQESGIFMPYNVKDLKWVTVYGVPNILVATNNNPVYFFRNSSK